MHTLRPCATKKTNIKTFRACARETSMLPKPALLPALLADNFTSDAENYWTKELALSSYDFNAWVWQIHPIHKSQLPLSLLEADAILTVEVKDWVLVSLDVGAGCRVEGGFQTEESRLPAGNYETPVEKDWTSLHCIGLKWIALNCIALHYIASFQQDFIMN